MVTGNHSWLLADPDSFGEVMTNIVSVAELARSLEDGDEDTKKPRELRSFAGARPSDQR